MDLLERYNARLKTLEADTVASLNAVLEASFNRLLRRVRFHLRAPYPDPAQRNLAILADLRTLLPRAVRPEALDAYDKLFRTLLTEGRRLGLLSAEATLTQAMPTRERIDVAIPLDATISALQQTKTFLARHGEQFATTASQLIAQGVLEGRPTPSMVRDLRDRLGVVRSRAETIVRTESIRAYGQAADAYYAAQGIDYVMVFVGADDRACPICSARAGLIYRRGDISVPFHPRCRCYLAPWDPNLARQNPQYAQIATKHRKEVAQQVPFTLSDDLIKAVFEARAPMPVA